MSCHICDCWTPQDGCRHYGPAPTYYKLEGVEPEKIIFSPEKRIEAYRLALNRVDRPYAPWVCINLTAYCHTNGVPAENVLSLFPEFAKYKPNPLPFEGENCSAWWDEDEEGRLRRKEVLQQCIEECLLLIKT